MVKVTVINEQAKVSAAIDAGARRGLIIAAALVKEAIRVNTPIEAEQNAEGHLHWRTKAGRRQMRPKPGTLKKSIHYVIDEASMEAWVTNRGRTFYGKFLEFGTSRMPAHPFMGPVVEAVKTAAVGKISEDLEKSV